MCSDMRWIESKYLIPVLDIPFMIEKNAFYNRTCNCSHTGAAERARHRFHEMNQHPPLLGSGIEVATHAPTLMANVNMLHIYGLTLAEMSKAPAFLSDV